MSVPWQTVDPLAPPLMALLRRRAIFDCCKWDTQVEDVTTIADVPVILTAHAWRELISLAESLARETMAGEEELLNRPELHTGLGLPRQLVKALGRTATQRARGIARLIRFDFHHTRAGWRISEANTDVPGGLNEASGLTALFGLHYDGTTTAGDVGASYARAVTRSLGQGAHVALAHATAYSDDRQVMSYLARRLADADVRASLVSPAHIRWQDGRARLETDWTSGPVDAIVRFFPAEWLANLPPTCRWTTFFRGASTPISNPATAILTQSKRFPLVWNALRTALPAWRTLLPETRDPRDAPWERSDEWVLKPALGRVGEDVGIVGVTERKEWDRIARSVRRHPSHWVAQRRFDATPLRVRGRDVHPSVGVYTIDGRVAGAYGRIAERPLIDGRARDAAVLVSEGAS